MSGILQKISACLIKKAPEFQDSATFGDLWKDHRLAAREISAIQPILEQNQVKLIGVGAEKLGIEEFVAGKFFQGDLYVDEAGQSYQDAGFKKMGALALVSSIASPSAVSAMMRAQSLGLPSNLSGNKEQNGGCLVVEKGGAQPLFVYVQEKAQEHVSNADVLKALGITVSGEVPTAASVAAAKAAN